VALAVPHQSANELAAAIAAAQEAARDLQRRPVDEVLGVLDRAAGDTSRT